jgi:glycerol-3-phosphate cytidylyltransferase
MITGYTSGVFDLFHVGHVNLLRNARSMCDRLIVGVTVDELVSYKGKKAMIPFGERIEIVRSCRYVDVAIAQTDIDKFVAWQKLKYDVLFVGDDWFGDETWKEYEAKLGEVGVKVVYIPYTGGVSSTILRKSVGPGGEATDAKR